MEMKKIRSMLSNNKGNGLPLSVAVTLCLVILFTGISEYFRLTIIAQGVRDALQDAVITTVCDNYDDVYHCVREGYSGGYQPFNSDFEESIDYGDIYERLDRILDLEQISGKHTKLDSEGDHEFCVWDLKVDIQNPPLAGGDAAGQRFDVESSILLEVPVSFGGKLLPSMQIKVKNSAGYTPKF